MTRRSHSKLLRARGVEPQLIAPMMGHRDSRMVGIVYGRLAPETLGALVSQRTGAPVADPYRQATPHPALEAPPLGPVRWAISDRSSGRYLTEARAQTAHQAWARAVSLGDVVLPFAECSFRVLEEQRA